MKKLFAIIFVSLLLTSNAFAGTAYNQYGSKTGSYRTNGSTTTTYDRYGSRTGSYKTNGNTTQYDRYAEKLELETGKKVVTDSNFLPHKQPKQIKKKD